MPLSTPISSPGISSGIDSTTIINQLVALQAAQKNRLTAQQTREGSIQSIYSALSGKLSALKTAGQALTESSLFSAQTATSSDPSVITASADSSAIATSLNVQVLNRSVAANMKSGAISAGTVDQTKSLDTAGLSNMISPGAGEIQINGVPITYNPATDTLNSIVANINNANAGVNATFDKFTQSLTLTDTSGTGAIDILDFIGNLGSALKLTTASGGTFTAAVKAQIKIAGVNNGNAISSNSDTFTSAETGLTGMTFNLQADTGSSTVTTNGNTTPLQTAFQTFATAYNDVQSFISINQSVVGTGKTAQVGLFHGDQVIQNLASQLRTTLGQRINDPDATLTNLMAIGFGTTSRSASVSQFSSSKLTTALTDDSAAVQNLVAGSNGVITKMNSFLTQVTGAGGLIQSKNTNITDTISRLSKSISREDEKLTSYETQLKASYAAMEKVVSSYKNGLGSILSAIGSTTGA